MSYDPPVRKLEDDASANLDPGMPLLFVRKATPANTSGSDGDYEFGQMSAGRLWVSATIDAALPTGANVIGAVTQSGAWSVSIAAGATAIGKAEDDASANLDVGVPAMAVRKATPANTSGSDGDYEFLQMSAGRLWCSVTVDAALPAGTNAIGAITNLAQLGGVNISMGTGVRDAGTQRVTIATNDSVPVTGPLTDAQLRAVAVPVSGTVALGAGAAAIGSVTLGAALPAGTNLVGKVGIDQTTPVTTNGVFPVQVVEASGTISALDAVVAAPGGAGAALGGASTAGSVVGFQVLGGEGTLTIQVSGGSWTGTLYFEGSNNATSATNGTWINVMAQRLGINETTLANGHTSAGGVTGSLYRLNCAGFAWVRVRLVGSVFTSSSTVTMIHSPAKGVFTLAGSLPTGANTIGALVANQSVNVAQINGVTPLMGAGNTGTGSHRVTIASDNAPVAYTEINPAVTYRGRCSTFRTPGLAGTAGQKIFAIHNATGSTKIVRVNRIIVDKYETVVKAVTVAPPIIRVHRVTVLPTNGTAGSKTAKDSALASNASITVFQGASADGTASGTALTATIPAGSCLDQEFASRLITAAGYEAADKHVFDYSGDEIVLRALEGVVVFLDYSLATQNPVTDMWTVTCDWDEFG